MQTPANKDLKILNIVNPGNVFLAITGNKCPNSEIARYSKDRIQTFSGNVMQVLVYLIATYV